MPSLYAAGPEPSYPAYRALVEDIVYLTTWGLSWGRVHHGVVNEADLPPMLVELTSQLLAHDALQFRSPVIAEAYVGLFGLDADRAAHDPHLDPGMLMQTLMARVTNKLLNGAPRVAGLSEEEQELAGWLSQRAYQLLGNYFAIFSPTGQHRLQSPEVLAERITWFRDALAATGEPLTVPAQMDFLHWLVGNGKAGVLGSLPAHLR